MPNHCADDLMPTKAISGLSRVRTELLQLGIVPSLAPHPVQLDRQFSGHRDLRNLSIPPHGEMKELAASLWQAAYADLDCFHQ